MKQLTCEICGSTDVIKQGSVFVCQECGCKYSIQETKNLVMGDDPNNVMGTVKVDVSSELDNLYQLARRARNDGNSENAQKYYEQIIVKDPSSWEANFYTVYYQSMNCKIAQIQSAGIRLSNCEDTVLKLIKENVCDEEERKKAVVEIATRLILIANMLYNGAKNHYNGIGDSIRNRYTQEFINNAFAAINVLYNFGNYVIEFFGDEYGKDVSVPCWTDAINKHASMVVLLANKESNKKQIEDYGEKIKKYKPEYQVPTINTSTGGCYVATCVYGSYNCPQVWTLRRFRDNTLGATWYGRLFIHLYYAVSPTLVKWFGETKWFKKLWKGTLDRMVAKLQTNGVEDTPYEDKNW